MHTCPELRGMWSPLKMTQPHRPGSKQTPPRYIWHYTSLSTETVAVLAIPGSITSVETLVPSNSKLSATCNNLAVIYTDKYELRRPQRENAKPRSSSGREVRCPSMHRSNKRCFSTPINACSAAHLSLGKDGPGKI